MSLELMCLGGESLMSASLVVCLCSAEVDEVRVQLRIEHSDLAAIKPFPLFLKLTILLNTTAIRHAIRLDNLPHPPHSTYSQSQ